MPLPPSRRPVLVDQKILGDLAEFARLEIISGDIEPWAATIGALALPQEDSLWTLQLYNCTDDLLSTFRIRRECPSPKSWSAKADRARRVASEVYLSGERRNLRGGKICRRLDSYTQELAGKSQHEWISNPLTNRLPSLNFPGLMEWLQKVWGVGRLSAFEWAEFLAKIAGYPVETLDGCLWNSSGPRESLERIYNGGAPAPSQDKLTEWAHEAKTYLQNHGAPLSWWDFETVICDFNVMRKGRYYPGKHLAMISQEIASFDGPECGILRKAFRKVIPEGWRDLPPGVNKDLCQAYRNSGKITTPEGI